jgi:GNAT superfamily N-acetyltransferase
MPTIDFVVAPDDFTEWDDLLDLLRRSFAYMAPRIDPPSSLNRIGLGELHAKATEETLILAQTHDGRPVGCLFAHESGGGLYIGKIAVDDAYRYHGIARRLVSAAEEMARQRSLPFLELQTRIELTENHRAFAALGFVKTAETAHPGYDRPTSITMRKAVAPA